MKCEMPQLLLDYKAQHDCCSVAHTNFKILHFILSAKFSLPRAPGSRDGALIPINKLMLVFKSIAVNWNKPSTELIDTAMKLCSCWCTLCSERL